VDVRGKWVITYALALIGGAIAGLVPGDWWPIFTFGLGMVIGAVCITLMMS
jgi:hypothetical protein